MYKNNPNVGGDFFFCYSRRCGHFLQAMGLTPVAAGTNARTKSDYLAFMKSAKLNAIIELQREVRFRFDSMSEGGEK